MVVEPHAALLVQRGRRGEMNEDSRDSVPDTERKIRLFLVDESPPTRTGLRIVLHDYADLHVVGDAGAVGGAADVARASDLDVVVFNNVGTDEVRRFAESLLAPPAERLHVPGIVLWGEHHGKHAVSGEPLNVAMLRRTATTTELISAIRIVAAGYSVLHRDLVCAAEPGTAPPRVEAPPASRPTELESLTDREHDVLEQLARGYTNAEISDQLYLGESTVKSHVQRVLRKLQMRNRVHAALYAREMGLGGEPVTGKPDDLRPQLRLIDSTGRTSCSRNSA